MNFNVRVDTNTTITQTQQKTPESVKMQLSNIDDNPRTVRLNNNIDITPSQTPVKSRATNKIGNSSLKSSKNDKTEKKNTAELKKLKPNGRVSSARVKSVQTTALPKISPKSQTDRIDSRRKSIQPSQTSTKKTINDQIRANQISSQLTLTQISVNSHTQTNAPNTPAHQLSQDPAVENSVSLSQEIIKKEKVIANKESTVKDLKAQNPNDPTIGILEAQLRREKNELSDLKNQWKSSLPKGPSTPSYTPPPPPSNAKVAPQPSSASKPQTPPPSYEEAMQDIMKTEAPPSYESLFGSAKTKNTDLKSETKQINPDGTVDSESETSDTSENIPLSKPGMKEEMNDAIAKTQSKTIKKTGPTAPSYIPKPPTKAETGEVLSRRVRSTNPQGGVSAEFQNQLNKIVEKATADETSPDEKIRLLENLESTASCVNYIPAGVKDSKDSAKLNKDDMKLLKDAIKDIKDSIKSQNISLLNDINQLSVKDMTDDLFNKSVELFSEIQLIEMKGDKISEKPGLIAFTDHMNQIQGFVSESILKCNTPKERAKVIEKFIDLAEALKNKGDFNTPLQILNALRSEGSSGSTISKLDRTWALVSEKKIKTLDKFEKLYSGPPKFDNLTKEYDNMNKKQIAYMPAVGITAGFIFKMVDGRSSTYITAEHTLIQLKDKLKKLENPIELPIFENAEELNSFILTNEEAKDFITDLAKQTLKSRDEEFDDKNVKEEFDDIVKNLFLVRGGVDIALMEQLRDFAPAKQFTNCLNKINGILPSTTSVRKTNLNLAIASQNVDIDTRNTSFQKLVTQLRNSPNETRTMKHPTE